MDYSQDLRLARAVVNGSTEAWHEFLQRYSGLIYGVIRRHLYTEENDEIRTVYVGILENLYEGELANYRGDSSLSTWLIVTTRSRTMDVFRAKFGRQRLPEGYDQLCEFDRRVLHCFYIQRLPLDITYQTLKWSGHDASMDKLLSSITKIEETLDPRYFARLDSVRQAKAAGVNRPQMLKYIVQLRLEYEEKLDRGSQDQALVEREEALSADRLETVLSLLTEEEREIIYLRFYRCLTARQIAEKLNLKNSRRAYTIINKILKKLRLAIVNEGENID